MKISVLEETLALHIKAAKLPDAVREHRFCQDRKWCFDFAWPALKLAVEVEGGTFTGGRHTRGSGFEQDCHKYNRATMDGWRVLRFTGSMVKSGEALAQVEKFISLIGD